MFTAQAGKVHVASFFLSLLLFSLTVAQQQCDVSAVAGDTVVIPLGYPGFTRNNDLTWKRDWVTVFQTRQGQVFVGAAGDVTGNGSLILPNVQKYQAGVYSATVLDVRPYFAQMTLCVQGQPPEAVYGLTGEEVELDPKVREPLVSIRWNKVLPIADWYTGGIQSYYYRCAAVNQCDLSLTTGVLKMKGLKAEDDGRYSVEINMKGIAREFDLVVLEPVSKPNVTRSCNDTQCTLVCEGQETNYTRFTWKENNEPVKEGNTLLVEKSGDLNKRYTCVLSNPASQHDSDPLTEVDLFLKIVSKPNVTTSCSETRCTLVCVGKETDHAKYTWKDNRKTLQEGNPLMVGRTGFLSTSYTCVLSNPKSRAKSDPVYEMDLFTCSSSHSTAAIVLSVLVAVAVVAALAGTYFKINPCRCLRRLKNRRVEPCGQATTPEQEAAPENNSGSSDRRETSSPVVLCSKRSFSHPHVSRIV